ncbi:MAG TPA: metal-dependent hydrolase [Dongiaceae bacterium]|nr:metal-dependent hydrolase [Dongiaceae bacterium]
MTTAVIHQVPATIALPGKTKPNKLKGAEVGIPVRKMGLTYGDDMPTLWLGGNAFLTLLFSAFSANLPEGEDQFVYSVRLFQDKITDPVLKAQVRAFIGQEAHHSREHEGLNEAMLKRGYRLDRIENRMKTMNKWMRKYQTPAQQLAGTVCGEHITALMADFALRNPGLLLDITPDPVRTTSAWHSIEELEHKGVAFDVYDQLVGDRKLLQRTMRVMLVFFVGQNILNALQMMPRTGQITNWKMWREAYGTLRAMIRFSRADYRDFFKPDYHPWQHDCRDTLNAARQRYLNEPAVSA